MMISPFHNTSPTPHATTVPENHDEWTIDLKIDIFLAQVDGWYLEVADRLINGWKSSEGEDYINGICPPQTLNAGTAVNHIPDSAYAALQIILNYFETIRFYKTADKSEKPKKRFEAGVYDVFPEAKEWDISPSLVDVLYRDLRSGLYHAIPLKPTKSGIVLSHVDDKTVFRFYASRWFVDPHNLVRHLRQHLRQFVDKLKDPDQTDLRANFEKAFDMKILRQE
jgi:hypothetical protein